MPSSLVSQPFLSFPASTRVPHVTTSPINYLNPSPCLLARFWGKSKLKHVFYLLVCIIARWVGNRTMKKTHYKRNEISLLDICFQTTFFHLHPCYSKHRGTARASPGSLWEMQTQPRLADSNVHFNEILRWLCAHCCEQPCPTLSSWGFPKFLWESITICSGFNNVIPEFMCPQNFRMWHYLDVGVIQV